MDLIRQLLAVAFVLGALAAAVWLLRRNGRAGWSGVRRKRTGRLEAIERLALSPQHSLHLVRFGDRALVIGVHAHGCSLIESSAWKDGDPAQPFEAGR